MRILAYGAGVLLAALGAALTLRYLGVADYGRYATVLALVAVVQGLTEAGLGVVALRDLAQRPPGSARRNLLGNLLGLRLLLTPLGVLVAVAIAAMLGYDRTLILGVAIAGVGLIISSYQGAVGLPLYVDVRPARIAALDLLQQVVALVAVTLLVVGGSGLIGFFGIPIVVGVASFVATVSLVGSGLIWRPRFDRVEWRALIHEALPLAVASVMSVIYFRVLIILMSLLASEESTGLYAASFRITAMLLGISSLVLSLVYPVLAVAAEQRERLRYIFQRMIDAALISSVFLAIVVVIVAEPVLVLLGGQDYRDATPVLRIQVFALIPLFFGEACGAVLIAMKRQSVFVVSGAISLAVVLVAGFVLIPLHGASGAAVAAVIAETILATVLCALLLRREGSLRPRVAIVWKVGGAAVVALGIAILLPVPPVFAAGFETMAYAAVLWFTRAVPPEVLKAVGLHGRRL
jgi:O-antigen/teichoic acid export membrane protein